MRSHSHSSQKFVSFVLVLAMVAGALVGLTLSAGNVQAYGTYTHCDRVTVTASASGALTNYPIMLNVYSGNGTSSGINLYLDGFSKSWPYDIRITQMDNSTVDSYWRVNGYNATQQTIWVNVPSIPSSGTVGLNVWFGKTGDTDTSNGNTTFSFFDDFLGTTYDASKWKVGTGTIPTVTIANGLLYENATSSSDWQGFGSKTAVFGPGYIMQYSIKSFTTIASGIDDGLFNRVGIGSGTDAVTVRHGANVLLTQSGSSSTVGISNAQIAATYQASYKSGQAGFRSGTNAWVNKTTNIPSSNLPVSFDVTTSAHQSIDYVFIRKAVTFEPAISMGPSYQIGPLVGAFTTSPLTTGMIGINYNYASHCTNATYYNLITNASWLSIIHTTGALSGIPTRGIFHVEIIADNGYSYAYQFYNMTVRGKLDPFTTNPQINALTGFSYTYTASCANASSYSLTTNASWLSIGSTTGIITGTPIVGVYQVEIIATNDIGNHTYQFYNLTVQNPPIAIGDCDQIRGYGTSWVWLDRLYYVYQGTNLAPYIMYYNVTTSLWSAPVKVGPAIMSQDGHGMPYMYIDPSGYIYVIYVGHGADTSRELSWYKIIEQGRPMFYKSSSPNEITSWTNLTGHIRVTPTTYDNLIGFYNTTSHINTLYCIYRNDSYSGIFYITSTDGGLTWKSGHRLIQSDMGTIYSSVPIRSSFTAFPGVETWMIGYTVAISTENQNNDVSMVIFEPATQHFYDFAGNDLGISLTDANLPTLKLTPYSSQANGYTQYFDCQCSRPIEIKNTPYLGWTVGNSTGLNAGIFSYEVSYYDFTNHVWVNLPLIPVTTYYKNDNVEISNISGNNIIVTIAAHHSATLATNSDIEIWRYNLITHVWSCDGIVATNTYPYNVAPQAGIGGWSVLSTTTYSPYDNGNRFIQIDDVGGTGQTYIYDSLNHRYLVNGTNIGDIFSVYNIPPWFASSSVNANAYVNQPVSYTPSYYAYNQTFTMRTNAPWLSINSVNGTVTGTPTSPGTYWFLVTLTDPKGSASLNNTVWVYPHWAPTFTSSPITSGRVSFAYSYTATVNESATITELVKPSWTSWTSPTLSGTPATSGFYSVSIKAVSTAGTLASYQNYTVSVGGLWAPTFTNNPSGASLGSAWTYTPTVNESATISSVIKPSGATFAGGIYSWTPASAGTYEFETSATSTAGTLTAYQFFNLTVSQHWAATWTTSPATSIQSGSIYTYTARLNESGAIIMWTSPTGAYFNDSGSVGSLIWRAGAAAVYGFELVSNSVNGTLSGYLFWNVTVTAIPPAHWAPTWTTSPSAYGVVGSQYVYNVGVNESSTITALTLPSWANYSAATVIGTPTANGTYSFSLRAVSNAGTLASYMNWTVTVAARQYWAPHFTSTPAANVTNGSIYSYTAHLNETGTITMMHYPSGAWFNSTLLTWRAPTDGVYEFQLVATSTNGTLSASQWFNVTVTALILHIPSISTTPTHNGTVLVWYDYQPIANMNVTWSLFTNADDWLSVNVHTGELSGTPTASGVYLVKLTATSAYNTNVTQEFNLTVAVGSNGGNGGDGGNGGNGGGTGGNGGTNFFGVTLTTTELLALFVLVLFIIVLLVIVSRRR